MLLCHWVGFLLLRFVAGPPLPTLPYLQRPWWCALPNPITVHDDQTVNRLNDLPGPRGSGSALAALPHTTALLPLGVRLSEPAALTLFCFVFYSHVLQFILCTVFLVQWQIAPPSLWGFECALMCVLFMCRFAFCCPSKHFHTWSDVKVAWTVYNLHNGIFKWQKGSRISWLSSIIKIIISKL